MPIYEFCCRKCQHEFEELVMRKGEVIVCPHCGSQETDKQVSGFAVTGSARQSGGSGGSCGSCKPSPGGCSGCSCH
jgi:putative FmdB family regulatory protein